MRVRVLRTHSALGAPATGAGSSCSRGVATWAGTWQVACAEADPETFEHVLVASTWCHSLSCASLQKVFGSCARHGSFLLFRLPQKPHSGLDSFRGEEQLPPLHPELVPVGATTDRCFFARVPN